MAAKKTGLMPTMTHSTSTTAALRFATSTAVKLRPHAPAWCYGVDESGVGYVVPEALSDFYSWNKLETNDIFIARAFLVRLQKFKPVRVR
ncbi:hypothetical protein LTR10_007081 [Elasticomyces elasticus]|nr:hypothetical protein LTR10_007081 [Elasticomyces elasticus]KAK4978899.1 hypothetical protein LTR42_001399 [Elasticomyces elasticus]